ncbi:MAG TPA: glycosyltransferase family 39 protein [Candidatus Udaeobacter sp.]|jgi:4-amino-4-deoxy-L-arabinose transferase-like glycosyltransferase|nr:glycosyltransferase family 39 protein [Candidatus Udaeobacter sp.]
MTRSQSRWVNVVIITLVLILRSPTFLPSLYNSDEGYYGIIANDTLDGGTFYQTAVDTKPPGIYYVYVAVFKLAGKNNLLAVHILTIFVVAGTALVVRRIGARVADDWAGAWGGIGYAVFTHAYRPGDTLPANTEIFANLFLTVSVLAFFQGERKANWSWMFLSGALIGVATLFRQPSAMTLGAMLMYLVYLWLIARCKSFGHVVAAGGAALTGFVAVIAALACYYLWKGNLHDAYLWAWAFAVRYVEAETTFLYVLIRLVRVHLVVMLSWILLWYFGIRQVIETLRFLRRNPAVPNEDVLLILWLVLSYLGIFIGWRFPGHYHLAVLPSLSILAGHAFSRFLTEQRRSRGPRWRWIRAGIIGAAALPAIGFLVGAFVVRKETLDFLPIVQQIVKETGPSDRIFVWGSSPQLYSFSNRRMATRFVSCSHLVGAYASRPREETDKGKTLLPGMWDMFRADWEAHPPELIIDLSTVDHFWAAHPMTRYPVLRAFLWQYRAEAVIDGKTIYRRI